MNQEIIQKRADVELNIAILNAITPDGFIWTMRDIASITGCSRGLVYLIEKDAIKKLSRNTVLQQYARDKYVNLCNFATSI